MNPRNPSLAIKGIRDALQISIPEEEGPEVLESLLQTIEDQSDFFRGARLVLEIGGRPLRPVELGRLREDLAEREVTLWAVLTASEETRSAAADLGLALEIPKPVRAAEDDDVPFDTEVTGDDAILVQRTLRSGNSVRHPGHVVVLGDVNPGAEIIAGGHIIVWGRLRGVVHAGATGDEGAFVCALHLVPTQLRIASHIATSPESGDSPQPEVALIRNGQLIAEGWNINARR